MFGGFDDIFGNMDRMMNNMNNMMNNVMGGGMMGGNMLMGPPFGMMNNSIQMMNNRMNNRLEMFGGLGPSNMSTFTMTSMPGQAVSYSSKVMTISNDGTGKPQVYEQTSSQICGPNGIREIKETVKDSKTGLQQIKVGRHINDRGHVKQKKRNVYQNEEEEEEEFINLDESEADQFHNEYNSKIQQFRQKHHSIAPPSNQSRSRLALTNGPSSSLSINQQPYTQAYNLKQEEQSDQRPPSRGKVDKKSKKKSKKPY